MFQKGEWLPFVGPEDLPSLCSVDKAGYRYGAEICQKIHLHGLEEGKHGSREKRGSRSAAEEPKEIDSLAEETGTARTSGKDKLDREGDGQGSKAQNDRNKIDFVEAVKWWDDQSNLRDTMETKREQDAFTDISKKNLLKFLQKEDHERFLEHIRRK